MLHSSSSPFLHCWSWPLRPCIWSCSSWSNSHTVARMIWQCDTMPISARPLSTEYIPDSAASVLYVYCLSLPVCLPLFLHSPSVPAVHTTCSSGIRSFARAGLCVWGHLSLFCACKCLFILNTLQGSKSAPSFFCLFLYLRILCLCLSLLACGHAEGRRCLVQLSTLST